MSSENIGVGKEVLSYCGKCKLLLGHLIVTMKDEVKPHKVQCLTCKANHAFRNPPGKRAKAAKKSPSKSASRAKSENSAKDWSGVIAGASGPVKDYSMKAMFEVGDLISHQKFGQGHVEFLLDQDKIVVLFESGIKTLVHGK